MLRNTTIIKNLTSGYPDFSSYLLKYCGLHAGRRGSEWMGRQHQVKTKRHQS